MVTDRLKVRAKLNRLKIAAVAEGTCFSIRCMSGGIPITNRDKSTSEFNALECRAIRKSAIVTIITRTTNRRQRVRKRQYLKCRTTSKCSVIDSHNPFRELNLGYAEILKGICSDCRHRCAVDRRRNRQRSGQCRSVGLYDVRERHFARTFSIGPFKTVAVSKLCRPCRSRATDRRADCHNQL